MRGVACRSQARPRKECDRRAGHMVDMTRPTDRRCSRRRSAADDRRGLPITRCLVELLIQEFIRGVKAMGKIWRREQRAEAILQILVALPSDDDPLTRFSTLALANSTTAALAPPHRTNQ